jgi:hypothetical protein
MLVDRDDRETMLTDTLVNLQHFAAAHGLDFDAALRVAARHFLVERADAPDAPVPHSLG